MSNNLNHYVVVEDLSGVHIKSNEVMAVSVEEACKVYRRLYKPDPSHNLSVHLLEKCPYCGNSVDVDVCWCGEEVKAHHEGSGHNPVYMGCTCGYSKIPRNELLIQNIAVHLSQLGPHQAKRKTAVLLEQALKALRKASE